MQNTKGYRQKLYPGFFELGEINREFETRLADIQRDSDQRMKSLGPKATSELRNEVARLCNSRTNELVAELEEKLVDIQRRHGQLQFNNLAYNYFSYVSGPPDDRQGIFEYMHWGRHGESLKKTADSVGEGDLNALRKLHRTEEDYLRVVAKKGPIKRFQGDAIHQQLLELMLCFEKEPMTEEERADCADDYCACGQTHDPDALDKQYRRLKKKLQASARPSKTVGLGEDT
jgi:hypothetical protein